MSDELAAGLNNAQVSLDGGNSFQPWGGSLSLGNLNVNETRTLLLRATVANDVTAPLTNTARVSAQTPDPNLENNTATITTPIATPRCQAWIDIMDSIALQEAALANLIQAEGSKMQKIIQMEDATASQLFRLNCRITSLMDAITRYELLLQMKLQTASNELADCNLSS